MRIPYSTSSFHNDVFHQNLSEYRNSGTYCDLIFIVGGEQFPCHRIIIASSSPYFQVLLTHQFKENKLESIELRNIEPEIFSLLLHYIYSGKIELDDDNVQELFIASDMLQLTEVVEFCCHYLSVGLTEKNVADAWRISDELECLSLKKDAEHYLLTNFRSVLQLDMMKTIPRELFIKTISNDDLVIDSEQQVLEAILVWSLNNLDQPLEPLFDNLRLEYISKEHQDIILQQIGITNPSTLERIEQTISRRECALSGGVARRGVKQTFYVFGGYGSGHDDRHSHLLTTTHRCHLNINENSSTYALEIQSINGDEMRYPRMHHQTAALGSVVYVAGGEDGDNIFNSVEMFDPSSKINNKQWTQTSSMITPRCNFGLVAIDSTTLYAMGGHIGADITASVEKFNCKTGVWTLLSYKLKSPCYGFACVQLDGFIICIGGSCMFNLPVKTIEIFNPHTERSYLCTSMFEARTFCSACVNEETGKVYVFGGADANGQALRSVEVYHSRALQWQMLPPMIYSRISPCVYRTGSIIVVFGGRTSLESNSETLNTAEIFDIEKNKWTRINNAPVRIHGAATVVC